MKKIGIIGGADPGASCTLYKKIIDKCFKDGCKNGSDFPEILILNYPFSRGLSIQHAKNNTPAIRQELQYCFDLMHRANIDTVAIACNTLHLFLDQIDTKNITVIHIVKEVIKEIKQKKLRRLLLLGTATTLQNNLYKDSEIFFVEPTEKELSNVNLVIDRINSGVVRKQDSVLISQIIQDAYKRDHFDGVVFGCTDLSVLNEQYKIKLKSIIAFDTIDILTERLTHIALS